MRKNAARAVGGATTVWLRMIEGYYGLLERGLSVGAAPEPRTDP